MFYWQKEITGRQLAQKHNLTGNIQTEGIEISEYCKDHSNVDKISGNSAFKSVKTAHEGREENDSHRF